MSAKKRKKRISYEEYYEKKYQGSKKIWIAVALLMIVTAAVLVAGVQRSNERQAQLIREGEQYYSKTADNTEE